MKRDLYAIKACTTKKIYCTVKKNKKTGNVKKSKSRYMTCANLHRAFITIYRFLSLSLSFLVQPSRLRIVKEKLQISQFIKKIEISYFFKLILSETKKISSENCYCYCDPWRRRWLPMKLQLLLVRFLSSPLVLATPSLFSVRLSLSLLLRCFFFSVTDTNGHRDCEIGYEFS